MRTLHIKKRRWVFRSLLLVLLIASGGVWWYYANSPRALFHLDGGAHAVAFSPDGKLLAVGTVHKDWIFTQGIIVLWDVTTQQQTVRWEAHDSAIQQLSFDDKGERLTSGALVWEGDVLWLESKTWDLNTYKEIGQPKRTKYADNWPLLSPDGKWLAKSGGGGKVILSDTASDDELFVFEADRKQLNYAVFSPDSRILATGGGDTSGGGPMPIRGLNGGIRLWDVRTGRLLMKYHRHGPIEDIAFSPDGKLVAAATTDGTVVLLDVPAP